MRTRPRLAGICFARKLNVLGVVLGIRVIHIYSYGEMCIAKCLSCLVESFGEDMKNIWDASLPSIRHPQHIRVVHAETASVRSEMYGLLGFNAVYFCRDRLCRLVVRVSGYISRGSGFDSQPYQIFWDVGSLERGPLSLVRTIEQLLEWKSTVSGLETRD
jgi:hypothetical protein